MDDSTMKDDREAAIKTNEHNAETAQGTLNAPPTTSVPITIKHGSLMTVSSTTPVKVSKATSELESRKDPIATSNVVQRKSVVTSKRKEELILEARKDRVRWIMTAPLPYEKKITTAILQVDSTNDNNKTSETIEYEDERLRTLSMSHVATYLPTAITVLNVLHNGEGSQKQLGEMIENVLGESLQNDKEIALPNGRQILEAEINNLSKSNETKKESSESNNDLLTILRSYQMFLLKLQDPACSAIVQGMRSLCRSIHNEMQSLETIVSKFKSYIPVTVENLKSNTAFVKSKKGATWSMGTSTTDNTSMTEDNIRRSFESFIYAHCNTKIRNVLSTSDAISNEKSWMEKVESLQFIEPKHLDIKCFDNPNLHIHDLLKVPIEALLDVDRYYSVYEKLQRILGLYRGINAALTIALNHNTTGSLGQERKLPSADDVLPTIIYTVLQAKPRFLLLNLKWIEEFSTREYLLGEAGYAYTNLYGAVQFILELDMTDEPKRLSITSEEYREGLKRCKAHVEENFQQITTTRTNTTIEESKVVEENLLASSQIPPIEVRLARLRGEVIDVDWALRWNEQKKNASMINASTVVQELVPTDFFDGTIDRVGDSLGTIEDTNVNPNPSTVLPTGFHRNYSFLTTRPEDIRVTDLPVLLEEYRMLVRVTETLLAEKSNAVIKARREKISAIEQQLYQTAQEIDPTLLRSSPKHSRSKSNNQ